MTQKLNTIWVIDDNPAHNFFHRFEIEEAVCAKEVEVFENARKALDELEQLQKAPELILLDVNMPQMTGFDFARDVQQKHPELAAECTIILISSAHNPEDEERAANEAAIDGYYTKPIDGEQLSDLLNRYFPHLKDRPA